MRIILLSAILIQISPVLFAQKTNKFDFFIGYGFYEGYSVGCEYYFKSDTQSLSLSIGYDKLMKQENVALTLGYNYAILKKHKNNLDEFKWHLNSKFVVWKFVDEYYIWKAISFIPAINRRFFLCRNMRMSFDLGPSFNIVVYNKRKTFKEVGWPYHVMPDFRILFIF